MRLSSSQPYKSQSARAAWWDYDRIGIYFVTINTAGRRHFFGEIEEASMTLSPQGIIADMCWQSLYARFPNWHFDEYVIMPDHFHGIFIKKIMPDASSSAAVSARPKHCTPCTPSYHKRFRNPGKDTLSSIVGSFKSSVTRNTRRLGYDFGWQSRFHDIIAKDDRALENFRRYVRHNVQNW